ncbi:MAG TPA: flagellar hook capping FlgD N-terminal domain-containing protein [Rhizomicrobium sp.]|jgi:flagellar basal-body rod modification protein FlgD
MDGGMQELSGNFNTFLTLLTTQLQNQDPLNPMDSSQFTQQLVEFSQVEQQIDTNKNLQTLIALGQANTLSSATNYLGKTITITTGNGALQDSSCSWRYALGADSSNTTLTVSDSNGKVVYSGAGETASGGHDFTWDGKDNAGNQMPDGVYKLSVTATTSDGQPVQSAIAFKGVVDEINLTGTEPLLMIGGMAVPLSQVSAVDQTEDGSDS